MIKRTLAIALTALALTTGFHSSLTAGEAFPSKPIQIIVPWAPGGGSDISARIVADKASKYLGEAMIISNMTGAAGLNGAQKVVKSAPDGYTILWEHPGNLAVTPLVAKARYTWKDFDIIGSIGASPVAVFTRGSSPWRGIMDAVKDMKANPGKIRWATTPNAASGFSLYAIEDAAGGFKTVIIPAQSDKNRVVSVLGDNSEISAAAFAAVFPYMKSGDAKILAMCSAERSPLAPEIPTLIDQGINATSEFLYTAFVPKGTPDTVKKTLANALQKATNDPEVVKSLAAQGVVALWRDAAKTNEYWEDQAGLFLRLGKAKGIFK